MRREPQKSQLGGLEVAGKLLLASVEVLADAFTLRTAEDEDAGFSYTKGIEGMSMAPMVFELLSTPETSDDFDALQQEFDKGWPWPVSFLGVSLWKTTAAVQRFTQTVGALTGVQSIMQSILQKPERPVKLSRLPELPAPLVTTRQDLPEAEAFDGPIARSLAPEALRIPTKAELRDRLAEQTVPDANDFERDDEAIEQAYQRCKEVTRRFSKTFFLGSQLHDFDEQRAVWAIYTWCRATDELVDGPRATAGLRELEAWNQQLQELFELSRRTLNSSINWQDLSLADSIHQFSLIRQPFEEMIGGMAMDLVKLRYATFHELEVYCYRVAGTVGLMTLPVLGFDPRQNSTRELQERTVEASVALGVAFQLTNILRDVGEDARRGRIYLPTEDLERFGISEEELLQAGRLPGLLHTEQRWRDFMEFQIERCEQYYRVAERGLIGLAEVNRLGVLSSLYIYRALLAALRANDYDNLSRRSYVTVSSKLSLMAQAWWSLNVAPARGRA